MFWTIIKIVFLLFVIFLLFIGLLNKGVEQKFGKFDGAPDTHLDKIIYDVLNADSIDKDDLLYLRKSLIELGATHMSMPEIQQSLKEMYDSLIEYRVPKR